MDHLLLQNPTQIHPIASITKLMTALVWAEFKLPDDSWVVMIRDGKMATEVRRRVTYQRLSGTAETDQPLEEFILVDGSGELVGVSNVERFTPR